MTLAPGTRLGSYEILRKIGAGGMGEVYKAADEKLGRLVAIKVLLPAFASDPERLRRFGQEARTASALNHPNILTVHDLGNHDGSPFLVMELLEGETLREKLGGKCLPSKMVLEIGLQIAKGLAAAHEKGIVHRDLKPENVFITRDERVKILDFGLAKLKPLLAAASTTGEEPTRALTGDEIATEAGLVLGTVAYMSPEQAQGRSLDGRSDLFSLGVILWEMVTGKRPFQRDSALATLQASIREEPPDLDSGLRVAPLLERALRSCLSKNPEGRFHSAHDLAFALQAAQDAGAPSAAAKPPVRPDAAEPKHARRIWPLVVALASALVLALGVAAARLCRAVPETPITSLAVLPLQNYSGDAQQEFFVDGMTDALIASLAQISALKVISRTSAMHFKGSKQTLPEIAKELGVQGILEGSVLRVGNKVRVTAQLIDARQDRHLWANNYEREMVDVLALQSEVARAIADQIRIQVTPQERERLGAARPVNREVYELCLKARRLREGSTPGGLLKAIEYLERAISLDPADAKAHAELSIALFQAAAGWSVLRSKDALPRAKTAAKRALELDESLAEAHAALGRVLQTLDHDWTGAEREFKRALELAPNSVSVLSLYSAYLMDTMRFDEAIALRRRAVELDPLSVAANDGLGRILYYAGRYDESTRQYVRILEMDPKNAYLHLGLSGNYLAKHALGLAVVECRRALALEPEDQTVLTVCGHHIALAGDRQGALDLLQRVNALSGQKSVDPWLLAYSHAGLGEKEQALDLLDRALDEHSPNLRGDPNLDFCPSLCDEPRYQEIRRRLDLPTNAAKRPAPSGARGGGYS